MRSSTITRRSSSRRRPPHKPVNDVGFLTRANPEGGHPAASLQIKRDALDTIPQMGRFLAVYNDLENYPTITAVAEELGLARKTVINRAAIHRNCLDLGVKAPP